MDRRGRDGGVDSMGKVVDGQEQKKGQVTSRAQDAGHWSRSRPGFLRANAGSKESLGDTRKWMDDEWGKDEVLLTEWGLVILSAQ